MQPVVNLSNINFNRRSNLLFLPPITNRGRKHALFMTQKSEEKNFGIQKMKPHRHIPLEPGVKTQLKVLDRQADFFGSDHIFETSKNCDSILFICFPSVRSLY